MYLYIEYIYLYFFLFQSLNIFTKAEFTRVNTIYIHMYLMKLDKNKTNHQIILNSLLIQSIKQMQRKIKASAMCGRVWSFGGSVFCLLFRYLWLHYNANGLNMNHKLRHHQQAPRPPLR